MSPPKVGVGLILEYYDISIKIPLYFIKYTITERFCQKPADKRVGLEGYILALDKTEKSEEICQAGLYTSRL